MNAISYASFRKIKDKFDFWRKLSISQKLSLISLVLILFSIPLGTLAILSPKLPLFSRASLPATPPTPTPVPGEILLNSSFEFDTNGDGLPDNWRRGAGSNNFDRRTDAFARDGVFSFKFRGEQDKIKTLNQAVIGNWAPGTTLYLSGWVKTQSLSTPGPIEISAIARYTDRTAEKFTIIFPTGRSYDWTLRAGSLTLAKTTDLLFVRLTYKKNNGEGFFDLVSLSNQPIRNTKLVKLLPTKVSLEEISF